MCRVVELTGDVTPDMRAIAQADLIVTTPEKWDGVSRSWQNRSYVQKVAILIIDEIHLLGKRPHVQIRNRAVCFADQQFVYGDKMKLRKTETLNTG